MLNKNYVGSKMDKMLEVMYMCISMFSTAFFTKVLYAFLQKDNQVSLYPIKNQ